MNDRPDRDPNLTNFLRQNRSISPPGLPDLEDRLLLEIDRLPAPTKPKIFNSRWRYLIGGFGVMTIGIIGMTIDRAIAPSEPSMAQLNELNLYLEAHVSGLVAHPESTGEDRDTTVDLDADLLTIDSEDI
ncbi:hypothetical protein [Chamaesiphon sp. VAR_48_metabat_403]|uniref:hypothetical protein n=1 Tax=Chamaesiphon sp. VAR_48_metabat_403 TaxID=2964700 RepID=UPI00286E504F|nr:hypothetical protein [Chamaesiphon sp. VAR_48_metabat_403]